MTDQDRMRLSLETGVSLSTVQRWSKDPGNVNRGTAYALRAGCKALGIDIPDSVPTKATDSGEAA